MRIRRGSTSSPEVSAKFSAETVETYVTGSDTGDHGSTAELDILHSLQCD